MDERDMSDKGTSPKVEPFRMATIGRHSMIYGAGVLATKAVAIIMLPVYTRWLTPADYGVLQLITMTFEVVTIFAGSRLALGVFHFYHKAADETGRREVLSTAFMLLAATYGFAAIVTVLAAPAIAGLVFGPGGQYATFIRLAATSMAFEGLILVPMAHLQLQGRSTLFVVVSIGRLLFQVALNLILLVGMDLGVLGVMIGSVTTHFVVGTLLGVHLLRSIGPAFQKSAARSFVRFGAPLILMQVATFIVAFGDRYFLNRAGNTTEVGLYGLAYQFGFLVATIGFLPFNQVWDPQRFAVAKRPDRDVIFAQVFVLFNILLFSVALGISLFAGDALRMISAPEFHRAAVFVPVLAAAYILPCWSSYLNLGTYITERPEYYTLAKWIAALVALAGYFLLIPRWLAWGATVTALVSLAVDAALSHWFSQRLWPVRYRWGPVVRLAALALTIGTASVLLPEMSLPASVGAHASLFLLYSALVWVLPILTREERAAIRARVTVLLRARAAAT